MKYYWSRLRFLFWRAFIFRKFKILNEIEILLNFLFIHLFNMVYFSKKPIVHFLSILSIFTKYSIKAFCLCSDNSLIHFQHFCYKTKSIPFDDFHFPHNFFPHFPQIFYAKLNFNAKFIHEYVCVHATWCMCLKCCKMEQPYHFTKRLFFTLRNKTKTSIIESSLCNTQVSTYFLLHKSFIWFYHRVQYANAIEKESKKIKCNKIYRKNNNRRNKTTTTTKKEDI